MSGRTAADPRALWLQAGRHRLEQALKTDVTQDRREGLSPDAGIQGPTPAPFGSAEGLSDRRTTTDRRVIYDRREMIRFEDDRRSGMDRRAGNDSWEIA